MSEVHFSSQAFCKILLHAAKYPHCTVNGLLLAETSKSTENSPITFIDAVPLFHICRFVSPMLEVALARVDSYCKTKGLCIAGYYQANENIQDTSPDFVAQRIADKVAENFSDASLVMVDNRKLCLSLDCVPFKVFHNNDGKWSVRDKSSVYLDNEKRNLLSASRLLQNKAYEHIIDFDNHFDDISKDWLNAFVNDIIQQV